MVDDEMLEEDSQALRSSGSQGEGLEVERMDQSGSGVWYTGGGVEGRVCWSR